jgi:glycosyltransferase involved in cell wall biosynthesis
MAAGLAIVCTPVDGNSELIEDEVSGMFVEPRAPAQLETTISQLLADRTARNRLGQRAQRRAEEKFSISVMVKNFTRLYAELSSSMD